MAVKQIPNLTPAVFVSPTAQLEIVQDGTTYRASAAQIAALSGALGELKITNDITDTTAWYPTFIKKTSGTTDTVYTSDPNYQYTPDEGRLSSLRLEATQGIVYNNSKITLDYVFPTDDNATSCGPVSVSAIISVPTGSEWAIV